MLRCFYISCSPFFLGGRGKSCPYPIYWGRVRHVPDNQLLSGLAQVRYYVVDQFQQLSYNALRTIQLQLLPHTCNQNHTSGSSSDWKKREELPLLLLWREIGSLVSTDCSRCGLAWGSAGRATGDQNSKVMGSNPTLVTVFLCPWGGLFFFVGLTLRWHNLGISQHRNLPLKATEERAIEFGCWN